MTTSIDGLIDTLVSPYLGSLRGQLAEIDATDGIVQASDFHSLLSWPGAEGRYFMVYNERAAVLFLNEDLAGVSLFKPSLLSAANPETEFHEPLTRVLAEGAL